LSGHIAIDVGYCRRGSTSAILTLAGSVFPRVVVVILSVRAAVRRLVAVNHG
jgi:hypothetical protein